MNDFTFSEKGWEHYTYLSIPLTNFKISESYPIKDIMKIKLLFMIVLL